MEWMASSLYGGTPAIQPTPTGRPDHPPGTPDPNARTLPRPGKMGDPTLALVVMLGLAIVLITKINR